MDCIIVYGNHFGKLEAVIDLAESIKESFINTGIYKNVLFSEKIKPNHTNIIIEELSSGFYCNKILSIKKSFPKTNFFLIITEIPINGSYNLFTKPNEFNKFLKNFNKKSYIKKIITHNNFIYYDILIPFLRILGLFIYLKKIINFYFSLIFPKVIINIFKRIKNKIDINIYNFIFDKYTLVCNNLEDFNFYARFNNTKFLINNNAFSKIFIINSSSKDLTRDAFGVDCMEFPYMYPSPAKKIKNNIMMFSGTATAERENIFKEIQKMGIYPVVNSDMIGSSRNEISENSMFSLHIPRYSGPIGFSSPTRTIHALKNSMLPVYWEECLQSDFEKKINIPVIADLLNSNDLNSDLSMSLVSLYKKLLSHYCSEYKNWNISSINILREHLSK